MNNHDPVIRLHDCWVEIYPSGRMRITKTSRRTVHVSDTEDSGKKVKTIVGAEFDDQAIELDKLDVARLSDFLKRMKGGV